jgi:tetratricopeptide (TPR) repeat protein
LKKSEIRVLADEAYSILDDVRCEAAALRAMQVIVNAPDDPESYLLMAEVAEENARFDQALTWINRGLSHFADHVGLLLKKASILLDGFEEIDEAFVILSKLRMSFADKSIAELKKDVGSPLVLEIYLLLGDCLRLKNDFNQAYACAAIACEVAPHDDNAILGMATAHFELGDYDAALSLIASRNDAPDFLWQKAQILCAGGNFSDADDAFLRAHKADKSRYHRPVRLAADDFRNAFKQAIKTLPREIRSFVESTSVSVADVVPIDVVKASKGSLSPQICMSIERSADDTPIIFLYQKNIENLATKRVEIKDLIASALIHDLAKFAAS